MGQPILKLFKLATTTIGMLGLDNRTLKLRSYLAIFFSHLKKAWANRPSLAHSFIHYFQPEAPMYRRGGLLIKPLSKRPRLVNLASDMEVFASQGSSLLVFMFLVWSFFARILLVICLISIL